MAKISIEDAKKRLMIVLKKAKKAITSSEAAEQCKIDKDTLKSAAKALMQEGKVQFANEQRTKLELVPAKEDRPSKKKSAPAKSSKKSSRDEDEDDDDDDDDDDEDGDEDDNEDGDPDDEDADPDDDDDGFGDDDDDENDPDEDGDEDDDDEDADPEEDEDEDDEDDDPPARKKSKGKPAPPPAKKAKKPVKSAKRFTMPFKSVDQLTEAQLNNRIELGLQAAEQFAGESKEGKVVAELIMRMIPKLEKQLAKLSD